MRRKHADTPKNSTRHSCSRVPYADSPQTRRSPRLHGHTRRQILACNLTHVACAAFLASGDTARSSTQHDTTSPPRVPNPKQPTPTSSLVIIHQCCWLGSASSLLSPHSSPHFTSHYRNRILCLTSPLLSSAQLCSARWGWDWGHQLLLRRHGVVTSSAPLSSFSSSSCQCLFPTCSRWMRTMPFLVILFRINSLTGIVTRPSVRLRLMVPVRVAAIS